jgi:transcriptional regulator with XRE-family HTH domain
MDNLKENISHNLIELRKSRKLTQSELAEKFNYSDKSISKWEHGETIPSIETLQQLCDFYGVTLDYLTHEITPQNKHSFLSRKFNNINKSVITALSITLVWLGAIVLAISSDIILGQLYWMAFVWAVPVSLLVSLVFNAIWGKKIWMPAVLTFLVWTSLAAVYCELGVDLSNGQGWRLWMLFLLGVPATAAAILWSHIKNPTPPAQ